MSVIIMLMCALLCTLMVPDLYMMMMMNCKVPKLCLIVVEYQY